MLVFREACNYFYETDLINSKLLDMRLITVGDYSCSGWIKQALWNKHKKDHPDHNPTMTFMRHLWRVIEDDLISHSGLSKEMC